MRSTVFTALAALAITAAAPAHAAKARRAAAPAPAKSDACDRDCLNGFADRYMDAMVAKTPGVLPWAKVVGFSEDGVPMMIGDAAWGSVIKHTDQPTRAADPSTGQVAWFGVVVEHGEPTFLALRLKVVDRQITEVETQIRRKWGPAPYGDPAAYAPDPAFAATVPAADRASRERLVALVEGYFNSVERNDGKVFTTFAPDCRRRDNGVVTTEGSVGPAAIAQGCEGQIKAGAFASVDRVRARAFPIVDETRGVVVATGLSDFSARSDSFRTTDGASHPTATKYPESQAFIQVFKIEGGAITRIETIYTPVPYLMPSPWTPGSVPAR